MQFRLFLLFAVLHLHLLYQVNCSPRRCKTYMGSSGLCVARRFCRIRSTKLSPCDTSSQFFCCPFPTNGSFDWSLEDREPILFPIDESGNTAKKPFLHENSEEENEYVDIVFRDDDTYLKFTTESTSTSTSSRNTVTQKISNTARERNPIESQYYGKWTEEDDSVLYEILPGAKSNKASKTTMTPFTKSTKSVADDVGFKATTIPAISDKVTVASLKDVIPSKVPERACGNAPFTPFIAGGTESQEKQWPWMAAIFQRFNTARPNKFLCGGSLISTKYILTAAHCCVSGASSVALPASSFVVRMGFHLHMPIKTPASSFLVRMGSIGLNDGDSFSISKVTVHKNFSFSGQFNDIALLRLTAPLSSYTDRIAPVCLPYPTLQDADLVDHQATVIGWGASTLGGDPEQTLHEVSVPIVSTDDCALAYSRIRSAAFLARGSTHVLCAGLKEGGKDSCKSDSGGPLMIQSDNDGWTIVGIVSFGYRCAEPGFPGVYTRITHYLEWVYSNTQE